MTEFAVGVLLGYLCGSVPFGLLIARWVRGVDLRSEGSGNIGATNAARVLGWRWGVLVLALDALKGAAPVLIFRLAIAGRLAGLPHLPDGIAVERLPSWVNWVGPQCVGLAAVLGHLLPVWLGFRGGKGVATTAGVVAVLAPASLGVAVFVFGGVVAVSRLVSLGSLMGAVALVVAQLVIHGPRSALTTEGPTTSLLFFTAALVFLRHRSNIMRLVAGTERRFGAGPDEDSRNRGVA